MNTVKGPDNRPLIIAEIGVNHNGDLPTAFRLVEEAKSAGADIAKFQVFQARALVREGTQAAKYQTQNLGVKVSQREVLEKVELPYESFDAIARKCEKVGIEFMASGFSLEDLEFINSLGVVRHKVPSGEITNLPYLERVASFGKPVLLSTGMSFLEEVRSAVRILHETKEMRGMLTILHCTSEYPTPLENVNLLAISLLQRELRLPVGYSDHTLGTTVAPAAVALGARVIEKHITLDRSAWGPDHKASLNPNEFSELVERCRDAALALGSLEKKPSCEEIEIRKVVRKSVVAATNISSGQVFSTENLATKRPATGISPMRWRELIGQIAGRDFLQDDLISE